ncbi:MAG: MOSC domain-containing protein [Phycisphaeraceae bacterium]|nr:MOSC domain-containing protein [Phycisphaeraceae bacterium]
MSQPSVVSVNVSRLRSVERDGKAWRTGIFKEPCPGPVRVEPLGAAGDAQGDTRYHGGPDRALYAYPHEHYAHWASDSGLRDWPMGGFGENLTTSGLDESSTCIGDVIRFGGIVTQVTSPRAPCATLAMRVGSAEFPRRFAASGRVGFYLRVLEPGEVGPGDSIAVVSLDPARLSVRDCFMMRHFAQTPERASIAAGIRALEHSWREWFEARAGRSGQAATDSDGD